MPAFAVTLNEAESRYEITSNSVVAGFAEIERRPGLILFTHTEVNPAFQGQGIASKLAAEALADAVATGDTIVPYCPYINKYLRTHDVPGAKVRFPGPPEEQG
ncbi:GNAT family N-acetyltransferase [Microbacterium panaciterrae]|uniref:N-acetyltransferase domain-containing protein n=1 Tax=Microbacterium panaciterrae TaxID=985759 RepID=A0ABP8P2K4_9MICO